MKEFNLRRWLVPLIYGLATANFVAVTQLICEPEVLPPSFATIPEHANQVRGFIGMIGMCISVPLLIAYAFDLEHVLEFGGPKFAYSPLGVVLTCGVAGLAFTLSSFHAAFGIAFFSAFMLGVFLFKNGFAWLEKRSKPN